MSKYNKCLLAFVFLLILCAQINKSSVDVCEIFSDTRGNLGKVFESSLVVIYSDGGFAAPKKPCDNLDAYAIVSAKAIFQDPIFFHSRDQSSTGEAFGVEIIARGKFEVDRVESEPGEQGFIFLIESYEKAKIVRADWLYDKVFVSPPNKTFQDDILIE